MFIPESLAFKGKPVEKEDEVSYDDVDGVQVDASNPEMGDLGGISPSGSGGEDNEISIDDDGDEQISASGNGGEDDEISYDDGNNEQSVGEENVLEPPSSSTRFVHSYIKPSMLCSSIHMCLF
ncbi:hypothetical protein ACFX2I_037221 [Malus domestica]